METLYMLVAITFAFMFFMPLLVDVGWETDRVNLVMALCWYLAAENLSLRNRVKKLEFLYGKPVKKDGGPDVQSSDSH